MALDIREGDVVRLIYTAIVGQKSPAAWVVCENGHRFTITSLEPKIEMVKRGPRPRKPQRQDFKAGDIVTGEQLRQVMWKRGTVIRLAGWPTDSHGSVLREDGRWWPLVPKSAAGDDPFDFETPRSSAEFELLHLPK